MTKTRSFLKWAGNKYNCLDNILPGFPPANRLIEPFTGSGAIFINSSYSSYLLAEKNPDLTRLFHFVQNEGVDFINYCAEFFTETNNTSEKYYALRKMFNESPLPRYKAALFLYLNRHGYNGLCRYNQKGIFNVPFGRYRKPYFPMKELIYFHAKSQQALFINGDFRQTFELAQSGDLVYCDPPYVPLSDSASFASYTDQKFSEQDQIDLAQLATESTSRGVISIISNHDTAFTRHHYQQGTIHSFNVSRFISCNAGKRKPVRELMAVFRPK